MDKKNNTLSYIKELIKKDGPLAISKYMEIATINEQYGYYSNQVSIGHKGDFVTSPEISTIFHDIITAFFLSHIQLNKLQDLHIIELGPGNGGLISYIASKLLKTQLITNITVHMVETSDLLKANQKKTIDSYNLNCQWHKDIDDIKIDGHCFILANEFLDAMPIEQFIRYEDQWHDLRVNLDNYNNLFLDIGSKVNLPLPLYLKNQEFNGAIFEQSTKTTKEVSKITKLLNNNGGIALIIDYGYISKVLTSTLQAINNGKASYFLLNPGQSDITAHVDFNNIKETANALGADTSAIITQREFMLSLGAMDALNFYQRGSPNNDKISASLNRLIDENQMGKLFKVIAIHNKLKLQWI